jgi:hypothetical protein
MTGDYLRDPKEIYRQSFATILKEADLSKLPEDIADLTVRLIHACGMPDIVEDLVFTPDAAQAGYAALLKALLFCAIPGWWQKELFVRVCLQITKSNVGITIRNVLHLQTKWKQHSQRQQWNFGGHNLPVQL